MSNNNNNNLNENVSTGVASLPKNPNKTKSSHDAFNVAYASPHILNFASKHLTVKFIKENFYKHAPKIAFLGLGQGGGRMAVNASTFGFPTYIFNSSTADMREHEYALDEERRIFTPLKNDNDEDMSVFQGTAKDANLGTDIAEQNLDSKYREVFDKEDVADAQFVFLCASLGGGTGTGAIPLVAEALQGYREYQFQQKYKTELLYNNVGLIVSLPSKSEYGIEYRRNAIIALQSILSLVAEKKIGVVYIIDNEYFESSDLFAEYSSIHNVDSRTFSNAVMSTSIIELLSFLTLKGSMSIDSNELQKFLGTPGFLNFKRVLQDTSFNSYLANNQITATNVSIEQVKTLAGQLAKELIDSPDFLCAFNEENRNSIVAAMTQIIADREIKEEYLHEIHNELSKSYQVTMDRGMSAMQSQNGGVSVFSAYVTNTPPARIKELKAEYDTAKQIEDERERKSKQSVSMFDDMDLSTSIRKSRRTIINTADNIEKPSSLKAFASKKNRLIPNAEENNAESENSSYDFSRFKKH